MSQLKLYTAKNFHTNPKRLLPSCVALSGLGLIHIGAPTNPPEKVDLWKMTLHFFVRNGKIQYSFSYSYSFNMVPDLQKQNNILFINPRIIHT